MKILKLFSKKRGRFEKVMVKVGGKMLLKKGVRLICHTECGGEVYEDGERFVINEEEVRIDCIDEIENAFYLNDGCKVVCDEKINRGKIEVVYKEWKEFDRFLEKEFLKMED